MLFVTIEGEIWAARNLDLDNTSGPDCNEAFTVNFDGLASTGFALVETNVNSGTFVGDLIVPDFYCSRQAGGVNLSTDGTVMGATYLDFRDSQSQIRQIFSPLVGLGGEPIENNVVIKLGSSGIDCQNTDSCLSPSSLTVLPGDEVFWFNSDIATHTVVSGNPTDGADGLFDSGFLFPGDFFSFVFENTGTFDYYDIIHPWIIGEVIVTDLTIPPDADVVMGLNSHNATCQDTQDCYQPQSLSINVNDQVT
jgi:plastocyanin